MLDAFRCYSLTRLQQWRRESANGGRVHPAAPPRLAPNGPRPGSAIGAGDPVRRPGHHKDHEGSFRGQVLPRRFVGRPDHRDRRIYVFLSRSSSAKGRPPTVSTTSTSKRSTASEPYASCSAAGPLKLSSSPDNCSPTARPQQPPALFQTPPRLRPSPSSGQQRPRRPARCLPSTSSGQQRPAGRPAVSSASSGQQRPRRPAESRRLPSASGPRSRPRQRPRNRRDPRRSHRELQDEASAAEDE